MKRADLLKHLGKQGCVFYREGKRHTPYINPQNGQLTSIPRHREINDFLVIKICSVDLNISLPERWG